MGSGLSFLVAARQCEIGELEQLARAGELVAAIGRFTHALQRERGISNIFLASQGARFGDQRQRQVEECRHFEQEVRSQFDLLDTEATRVRNGARLFSRIAIVLHELDALDGLRQRVGALALTAQESTGAFVRLVAGLLAVVFEAVDSATDPGISRALLALFNFMQGKEFAGQERALGAAVFAAGRIDAAGQQQWRRLIESQENCFQVFAEFSATVRAGNQSPEHATALVVLDRLRRLGANLHADGALDANLSQIWYDCCTHRIDAMKTVEDLLAADLRRLCEVKIARARAGLRDQQAILHTLQSEAAAAPSGTLAHYGPQLERSVLEMVQEQSRRLQAMSDELDTVRAALNERKVVERAKGILMAQWQLGEDHAYRALRQMAMNQKRKLVDVAESVLAMADALPERPR